MTHCKDCKHWLFDAQSDSLHGVCELISTSNDKYDHKQAAYCTDSEGYWAGLNTLPGFGCVLGEPKTPREPYESSVNNDWKASG